MPPAKGRTDGAVLSAKDPVTLGRARAMRQDMTPAEQILWNCLRNKALGGFKFSRQVPIGKFIADFVCRSERLVIEVDGATHSEAHELKHDWQRSQWLRSRGYEIHRVWNQDVYENLAGVLDTVLLKLNTSPHPRLRRSLSPEGERGRSATSPFSPLGEKVAQAQRRAG
ncbi:MAG: endonuclease domain-containing protein [Alphaproteobacteria bacterium]|nr:endonuclease domain-containing protein [Alphaproteobacteria bacterium]